jgi:hypothetical protein
LVRAPALQAGCRGFESLSAHHHFFEDSGHLGIGQPWRRRLLFPESDNFRLARYRPGIGAKGIGSHVHSHKTPSEYRHDEPACFDPIFMRWIEDSLAGRTPQIDRIGISYMYFGAWQSKDGSSGHEFHVGPHLMIVSPHQDDFQGINRDPSNGMPYVAHLPHRTEMYLVMPARRWNE